MQTGSEEFTELLKQNNKMLTERVREQANMIENLQSTIDTLNASIANLQETIEDLRRRLFGTSSEKIGRASCRERV